MKALAAINSPAEPTERRISKRVRHACELLLSGECKTIKAAAHRANLSREHLSKSLRLPHVQAFISRQGSLTVATAQMRANTVLQSLMDEGKSEHVRKDVARYFMELAGYVVQHNAAPATQVNLHVTPGYVVMLGDQAIAASTVDHDPSERGR
jgi:hypothetical protein